MAVVAWLAGFLRVFWVCRVGLVDVVVGLLFFGTIMQAQNLMADLSSSGAVFAELFFWAGVFVFAFLLWAFPVHYGARRSLDQLARMAPGVAAQHRWLIALLPRLLGLLPFVALALGINGARTQAAGAAEVLRAARQTMAQGLWLYAADAVTAVLFVVFVYFRRRLVPRAWNGRLLHPLALVATAAIFAAAYVAPLATSVHVPRALLVPPLFGSLVLGAGWLTRLGDRTGFPFLATLALLLGLSTGLNAHFNDLRTLPSNKEDGRFDMDEAVARWTAANHCSTKPDPKTKPCPHPIVVAIDGGASRAAFTAATFVGELLDRMPKPKPKTDNKTDTEPGEAQTPGRRIFAISGVSGGAYGASVIQSALIDAQRRGDGMTPPCRSAQTTWFGFEDWRNEKKQEQGQDADAQATTWLGFEDWGEKGHPFTWRQCLQALTSGDYLSSTIIGLAFRDFAAPPWQRLNLPAMEDRAAILEMTWERQYAATMEVHRSFFEAGDRCHRDDDSGLCRRMAHPRAVLDGRRWMPMLLLNGTSVASGRRIVAADLKSTKPVSTEPVSTEPVPPQDLGVPLYSQAFDLREAMSTPCTLPVPGKHGEPEPACATQPPPVDGPDVRLSTAALTSARFPIISPAGVFHMMQSGYGDQVVDGGYFENSGLTTALDVVHALEQHQLEPAVVSISNDPAYAIQDADRCNNRFGEAKLEKAAPFFAAKCTGLPPRPALTPLVGPADDSFLGRFFALFSRPFQTLVATGDGHADELMALIKAHPPPGGFYHLRVVVTPNFGPDDPEQARQSDQKPPEPNLDDDCQKLRGKTMTMSEVSMSWWLSASAQADLDVQRCDRHNRHKLDELVADIRRGAEQR